MTLKVIFCGYCVWSAYDLPSDARAFSLTSFEMLRSSMRLNQGFRLLISPKCLLDLNVISDFIFVRESDGFLQCFVTLGPGR